jgi:hypothetical protein
MSNKLVTTATNEHVTIEEMLEAVFSVVRTAAVAMQRRGKHVSATMNRLSITEEFWKRCFLLGSCKKFRAYIKNNKKSLLEAGSNTSTIAL